MNPLFYCINLFRFDENVGFEIISVGTAGLEPATSAMWLQRSKPTGLRPYRSIATAKLHYFSMSAKLFAKFFSFFWKFYRIPPKTTLPQLFSTIRSWCDWFIYVTNRKLSLTRLECHSGLANHRRGQITIFPSLLPRYCDHHANVELEMIKWWQLYISRNVSHAGSSPRS